MPFSRSGTLPEPPTPTPNLLPTNIRPQKSPLWPDLLTFDLQPPMRRVFGGVESPPQVASLPNTLLFDLHWNLGKQKAIVENINKQL
jgi:hypothetical protein